MEQEVEIPEWLIKLRELLKENNKEKSTDTNFN